MKLIALKDFSPDGSRHLKVGDVFEISAKSAGILIQSKRARLAEEEEPKKFTGKYQRKDMRAAAD